MCISSMCHACLERRMIYVKIQHFIPSRSLPSRKGGLCNHFPTAQKTSKINRDVRRFVVEHTEAGGEWRCGRKGHQESLQDQKQTMGWWKVRVHDAEHLEFTENCSMHKAYRVFSVALRSFGRVKIRIICECRISHIYIYMYIHI